MNQINPKASWIKRKFERARENLIDMIYGVIGRYFKGYKKTPVFLVGTQRSGTTMLIGILRKSPYCMSFEESDGRVMRNMRLREEGVIKQTIQRYPHSFHIFKPLNDSQYIDKLLENYDNAKSFWVYRSYGDVINSAVQKWGDWQKIIVLWIKNNYGSGQFSPPRSPAEKVVWHCAIYLERLTEETWLKLRELATDDISAEDGAALLWYIRNQIFFDLNFDERTDLLLVKYEELVTNPGKYLKRVFDYIGCEYKDQYADGIHVSSVGKKQCPKLIPAIKQCCDEMQSRLDKVYYAQIGD